MPSKLALEALESYKEAEESTPDEDGYSADLEAEMGAMDAAMKKGDLAGAAKAFEEAVKLCRG